MHMAKKDLRVRSLVSNLLHLIAKSLLRLWLGGTWSIQLIVRKSP